MTPAKMFEGDLWVLASDAVQMSSNAYKNGQADEREECAKVADGYIGCDPIAAAIRARGQA
jgi:hypothetical protein